MGLLFWRDRTDEKLAEFHSVLSDSFARVKADATTMSQWVEYLYHLAIEQQRSLNDLKNRNTQLHSSVIDLERVNRRQTELVRDLQLQLKSIPSTPAEIRRIVDAHYSFEPVLARIKHFEEKLAHFEAQKAHVHEPVHVPAPRESSLKEKILRRITRNSKNFIKSSILSLIAKYGQISALQMREMIVEEQGLCSKSSFYRLLEELEQKEGIRFIVDGKEKVYFAEGLHTKLHVQK